jgi:phenylpropionate dioxygenase-like ring-hydroxylating dioxygenase large terminal subunit
MPRQAAQNPLASVQLTEREWKALEATCRLRNARLAAEEIGFVGANIRTLYASMRLKLGCPTLKDLVELVERHGLPPRPK